MMLCGIKLEVVAPELRDMNHTFNEDIIQCDKYPKASHPRYGTGKLISHPVTHVITLQPCLDLPGCFVSPTFSLRAMHAQFCPATWRVAFPFKDRLNGPMYDQVRVAPNRRCKVPIGLISKAEMSKIFRAVSSLLKRAQQYRLQQLEIRARFD